MGSRLIVASTRLPITLTKEAEGWHVSPSTGGLVTALAAVREKRKFTWLGWPGAFVDAKEKRSVTRNLARHGTSPVFISREHMAGFYEGFSNEAVWPLFHNLTERSLFNREHWASYVAVNQMYADAIAKEARPGDTIWVHDYQLCLVPQMLREKGLGCSIGFFLHIPFPSADAYRMLPVAEDLLKGMLGADLIGFHAYEYVSHFRMTCLRVLGVESETSQIGLQSRRVRLEVMPIGIDPDEVRKMLREPEARREQTELERTFAGKRIIVGVDRLDYTKGLPQKLLAFEEMLKTHPQWRHNTVLVQIAAPSRTGVEEYQHLKREVDELVGRINGEYSTPSHTPVVYINQAISRTRLTGVYRAADIAMVTPLRDGMNLVALEYVAARKGRGGSLILSEFCGAAHCMPGSRLVNPYNTSQVAAVLGDALENDGPQMESFAHMQKFVEENTSMAWAEEFLEKLDHCRGKTNREITQLKVKESPVYEKIKKARRPLVFLDYDGTLRSYVINPKDAVPDRRILNILERLSKVADVYVVSGRDGATLEEWLGHLDIGLVCEHGLAMKMPDQPWQGRKNISGAALTRLVKPLFKEYVQRTPGSTIEVKQAAIAWHSRASDPEYSAFQSKELVTRLGDLLKRRPYKVLRGNRVIEVRHEAVTKGSAVEELMAKHSDADFLFCAGDDRTDEDMMAAIPDAWRSRTVTCWVGSPNNHADYWRASNTGLLGELESMAAIWEKPLHQRSAASSPGSKKKPVAKKAAAKKAVAKKVTPKKAAVKKAVAKKVTPKKAPAKKAVAKKGPAKTPAAKNNSRKKS